VVTLSVEVQHHYMMDEFQFIESLDALLANEALDETATTGVDLVNTSLAPLHGQGILSGPTVHSQIAETASSSSTTWLGRNDNNISRSDPFAIPLHSNQGLMTTSTTPSAVAAPYPQYTSAYNIDQQQTQKGLGPILPSASPAGPLSSLIQRPSGFTTAASVAPSGVASVCSANSLVSSNASSSRRKGGSKCNNSTMSVGSVGTKQSKSGSQKRTREWTSTAVSDSEDDSFRRRHDRNLREQRRSQKITIQIDQLREVLAAASVRFKPDKYSTLVSVVEYVKQLQGRSTMLDMEHKKLLDTISRTNEIVHEPYLGNSGASASSTADGTGIGRDAPKPDSALSNGAGDNKNANGVSAGGAGDIYNDDELVFVRNVDYKCIFDRCGMPLAVASIDGRLMDCNSEFVELTGYRREELLPNERYQKQRREHDLQQQGSAIVADDINSSFSPDSIFPDRAASSNSNALVNKSDTRSGRKISAATHSNNEEIRNFSLFNLISRNNMEEVFVSLSEMLKQPPTEEDATNEVSNADYWSGNVRLSRNSHLEMRINVSLVRSPQGRAKFFDCSLTPLTHPCV